MSAVSSRPRVHSVSSALIAAVLAGGAYLAREFISAAVSSLRSDSRDAFRRHKDSRSRLDRSTIPSGSGLAKTHKNVTADSREAVGRGISPVEALKVSTLLHIDQSPCWVQDGSAVRNAVHNLVTANNLRDGVRSREALYQTLQSEHRAVFVQSLTAACGNACSQLGFDRIEAVPAAIDNRHRLVASHANGQSLVVEIHTDEQGHTNLATEVVGVHDGTCNELLDAFDDALEAQGVRGDPPDRKFTGGVCELTAAREFVKGGVNLDHFGGAKVDQLVKG